MSKSADAFRTISEVAEWLETPAHVLRFWESKFTQVKPVKRAGGRRYYRPSDMRLLGGIKKLLHDDGMTIKGVQKLLREQGVKHVSSLCALSLGDEDEVEAVLLEDVPASEPVDTVVPFAKPEADAPLAEVSPPESAEPAPVEKASATAEEVEVADAPTAPEAPAPEVVASEPATPVAEDAVTEPVASAPAPAPEPGLPSFLQRSMADRKADETASEPETAPEPETPKAAPEPPAEPAPSALTYLARVRKLSPEQAQKIAPILEQLKAIAS